MAKKKKGKTTSSKRTEKSQQQSFRGGQWVEKSNDFVNRHANKVVLFLFVLSMSLSAVYFVQGHNSPLKSVYTWKNSDMAFFDTWAKHVAKSDWWCDTIMHPYHEWHDRFASNYLYQYPDIAETYYQQTQKDGTPDSIAARHALINEIYKGKTFHQEPLYTYMLAATYALLGENHRWVYFWQFILAALTGVLVYLIGKRYFGPLIGLIAALLVIGCGTIMVYEMVLLRTTLTNFFTVLLLYVFLRAMDKPVWQNQVWFGVVSGFAVMAQSYFILFLIPAWAWMIWIQRKKVKQLSIQALTYTLVLLITLSPLCIRNLKVGVSPFAMAGNGAMTYIPMNTKYSTPMQGWSIDFPTLVKLRHDGQGNMIPTALKCLNAFDSFQQFVKIYIQKVNALFMWYEIPNNVNYYLFKEYASILGILPFRYFFIAPLGLAGLVLGFFRYRLKFIPFLIMLIASIFPMFIAGSLARLRTPLVIMMCLAAALFIVGALQWFLQKKWKPLLAGMGIFLLALIYTSTLVSKSLFLININDLDPMYKLHYANPLLQLERENNEVEYLRLTTEMMSYIPDYFFESTMGDKIKATNEADACRYVVKLIEMHAGTLESLNKTQEAAFYKDRIIILNARVDEFARK